MGDPMKLVKIVRQKHGIDSCESQLVIKRDFSCFSTLINYDKAILSRLCGFKH